MSFVKDTMEPNDNWSKYKDYIENTDIKGETSKAYSRRVSEGWFEKYAPEDKSGIDIGAQIDPLNQTFRRYDLIFGDGDATYMHGIEDNTFWTVYASHILEHISFTEKAIRRWYDILKPGGHLIICVPHRDLYEKKRFPPSNWNPDHKYFWLPDKQEPPAVKCLKKEVLSAIPNANIVSYRVLDEGFDHTITKEEHSIGEFSIECIVKK